MATPVYWLSPVPGWDDFGRPIHDRFYDAATNDGPWAIMAPDSYYEHARYDDLGTGKGQRYELQPDGKWLKTKG